MRRRLLRRGSVRLRDVLDTLGNVRAALRSPSAGDDLPAARPGGVLGEPARCADRGPDDHPGLRRRQAGEDRPDQEPGSLYLLAIDYESSRRLWLPELAQRSRFELPDTLARQPDEPAYLVERVRLLVFTEPESQRNDLLLARLKCV